MATIGVVSISEVEIADEEERHEPDENDGQQPGAKDVARSRSHSPDHLRLSRRAARPKRIVAIVTVIVAIVTVPDKCARGPATQMAGPL